MPGVVAHTRYPCSGRVEVGESLRRPTNHYSPTGKVHTNKVLSLVPCIGDRDTKKGNYGRGNSKKKGGRVQIMKYGGYGGGGGWCS